jgi:hypothetical protein
MTATAGWSFLLAVSLAVGSGHRCPGCMSTRKLGLNSRKNLRKTSRKDPENVIKEKIPVYAVINSGR